MSEGADFSGDKEAYLNPTWGAQRLKSIFLFSKLEISELVELYQHGRYLTITPGSHAVIEGEMSRGMYLILQGSMSVYKNDPVTGSLVRLAVLEAGANFGEFSLFDAAPRSATVAALTKCFLFVLEYDGFESYLYKQGADTKVRFYSACAEELAVRFRQLNSDYLQSQRIIWRYALRRDSPAGPTPAKSLTDPKKSSK
jgi:CRP-like cAMP-binding protein